MYVKVLLLALSVTGCSQMTPYQAASSGQSALSKEIQACGVRLRFSSEPRPMRPDEIKPFSAQLTNYFKWDVAGWIADQYRLTEVATCQCRDSPFTTAEIKAFGAAMKTSPAHKNMRDSVIEGIGFAVQAELVEESTAGKDRIQAVYPAVAPSCVLIQVTRTPAEDARGTGFFSSVSSMQPSKHFPYAGTVSERLKLLESLKVEGLITLDEYNSRKKAILESL